MSSGELISSRAYGGYFVISAAALCCYEYILTFAAEIKFVWRRRFSAGSVLYVLNRYAILCTSLASIYQVLPWPAVDPSHWDMTCVFTIWIADVCLILVYLSYGVFAALRMYALYGKNKIALVLVLSVAIIGVCALCYLIAIESYAVLARPSGNTHLAAKWGSLNCYVESREIRFLGRASASINTDAFKGFLYFAMAVRLHSLLFEIMLLGMTWSRTLIRSNLRAPGFRAPFTTVLLRDGTLYFMATTVVIGLHMGGIVAAMRSIIAPSSKRPLSNDGVIALSMLRPQVDTITSICMSRFLLNLLAAADGDCDTHYRSSRWNSVLRFAQVEALGAPLRGTADLDLDDEDGIENTAHPNEIELMDIGGHARCEERSTAVEAG